MVAVAVIGVRGGGRAAGGRGQFVGEVVFEGPRAGGGLVAVQVVGVRGRAGGGQFVGDIVAVVGRAGAASFGEAVSDLVVGPADERVVGARAAGLETDARQPVVRIVAVGRGAADGSGLDHGGRVSDGVERVRIVGEDRTALGVLDLGQAVGLVVSARLHVAIGARQRR